MAAPQEPKNIIITGETIGDVVADVDLNYANPGLAMLPAFKFIQLVNAVTEAFKRFHDYSVEHRLEIMSEPSKQHSRLLFAALQLIGMEFAADKECARKLFDVIIEYERHLMRVGNYGRKASKTIVAAFRDFLQRELVSKPGEIVSP